MEWNVQGKCGRYLEDSGETNKKEQVRLFRTCSCRFKIWSGREDLNLRPPNPIHNFQKKYLTITY